MKKILLGLAVLTALGLQANDEMKTNMAEMRSGLQSIQDGFSYNNKADILAGIERIQQANNMFHDEASAAKFLSNGNKSKARVSYLSTRTLNTSLNTMREYINTGDVINAADSMTGVVKSCTRCHAIVRGW